MSATDWYICPKCKENAIKHIDLWYGVVSVEEWNMLLKFRQAWEDENTDFTYPKGWQEIFDKIEDKHESFEQSEIVKDDTIVTLRYDSDSGINKGILMMNESYDCQCCDFSICVNKSWAEGNNVEAKK
jgi:hypothetical protein